MKRFTFIMALVVGLIATSCVEEPLAPKGDDDPIMIPPPPPPPDPEDD